MNKIKMKTTFLQVENFLSSQQHKERKEDILSKKKKTFSVQLLSYMQKQKP